MRKKLTFIIAQTYIDLKEPILSPHFKLAHLDNNTLTQANKLTHYHIYTLHCAKSAGVKESFTK